VSPDGRTSVEVDPVVGWGEPWTVGSKSLQAFLTEVVVLRYYRLVVHVVVHVPAGQASEYTPSTAEKAHICS
jgi:hypothetical protein